MNICSRKIVVIMICPYFYPALYSHSTHYSKWDLSSHPSIKHGLHKMHKTTPKIPRHRYRVCHEKNLPLRAAVSISAAAQFTWQRSYLEKVLYSILIGSSKLVAIMMKCVQKSCIQISNLVPN